jgi:hypothetical protein
MCVAKMNRTGENQIALAKEKTTGLRNGGVKIAPSAQASLPCATVTKPVHVVL